MADPDGAKLDLRTVFVKGVSFDSNDKDFEEALSNIGPLRKCFLLKGAGKNHKVYLVTGLVYRGNCNSCEPPASFTRTSKLQQHSLNQYDIRLLQGCGFATFALKEDAKRAIEELSGHNLGGRTIQVLKTSQLQD